MRYIVRNKGSRCLTSLKGDVCILDMFKQTKYPKHREEIEEYLENMNEPTLIDNGDGTVTLEFDPIPEQMATWMVNSKTTFFNVVRQHIGHRRSGDHLGGNNKRYNKSKQEIDNYFPYGWNYVNYNNDSCIVNNRGAQAIRTLTVSELTSGSVTRDISFIYNLSYSNSWNGARGSYEDFMLEFYLGFIYYDADNKPTIYNMGYLEIPTWFIE